MITLLVHCQLIFRYWSKTVMHNSTVIKGEQCSLQWCCSRPDQELCQFLVLHPLSFKWHHWIALPVKASALWWQPTLHFSLRLEEILVYYIGKRRSDRHAPGNTQERHVRSRIWWFAEFCNSHYLSHFAALFIVVRTKISTVKSCFLLLWYFLVAFLLNEELNTKDVSDIDWN